MKRALKSKKAFTLVELIVVIALMGIVGLAVTLIFVSANETTVKLAEQTDINVKTNYVMETVQTQLRFAGDLAIGDPADAGADADRRYLYSEDGKIYIQEGREAARDMFDEAFYQGYSVGMEVTLIQKNVVILSITTESKNNPEVAYSLETEISAMNTQTVEGAGPGSMIAYTWSTP